MTQIVSSNSPSSLIFTVTKQEPELIAPINPTPNEIKQLSVIDYQKDFQYVVPGIQFYRCGAAAAPDAVKVIREALGKALVSYYPLAGRLREKEDGKLVVECNGEGIMFIEADADVTLAEFGEDLKAPFPCMEDLLHDLNKSDCILDYPLLLIQVTRLRCGGFIFAHKFIHAILDGSGYTQFMDAVAELARGAEFLSVEPVWERHRIQPRDPPEITCVHHEYDKVDHSLGSIVPFRDVVHHSFFFGPSEIASLRRFLPGHLKSSTSFEIITACIWRSRTMALQFNPDDEVRLRFLVNARYKFNPPLPKGFYGNAVASPVAITTANNLLSNPIEYALELIRNAKHSITEEYVNSMVDFLLVNNGRMFHGGPGDYTVSDVSRVWFNQWDFGWGKAVFGGPAKVWFGESTPGFGNYYLAGRNDKGENGIIVPMWLPRSAMDRFIQALNGYMRVDIVEQLAIVDPQVVVIGGNGIRVV